MHDVVGFFGLTYMTSIKTRRTMMNEDDEDDEVMKDEEERELNDEEFL